MKSPSGRVTLTAVLCVLSAGLGAVVTASTVTAAETAATAPAANVASPAAGPQSFDSPTQAADAMIEAAEKFDVTSLLRLVGHDGEDVVLTEPF